MATPRTAPVRDDALASHEAGIERALAGYAPPPPPIQAPERAEFRARLAGILQDRGVDAMLIEPGGTLEYLTGVAFHGSERLMAAVALADGSFTWVTPAFEATRVEKLCSDAAGSPDEAKKLTASIEAWNEHEDAAARLAEALKARGASRLAADPDVRARFLLPVGAAMGRPVENGAEIARALRGVKTAREIEILRSAQERTQDAIRAVHAVVEPGLRSSQVGQLAAFAQSMLGLTHIWDLSLAGPSGAYPHGDSVDRELEEGSVMLLDTGGRLHGYCSDTTRTWTVAADPTDEYRRVWEAARAAQVAAYEALRPGARCGDADVAARAALAEHGFDGAYGHMGHRLGHGIGVEIHEPPYLDGGSDVAMEPGMCFTNEPGVYQPGKFGLRVEDICFVTEDGADHFGQWQEGPEAP